MPTKNILQVFTKFKKFNIKNFIFKKKNKEIKMSIDTKKDLKVILKKFDKINFKNYSLEL